MLNNVHFNTITKLAKSNLLRYHGQTNELQSDQTLSSIHIAVASSGGSQYVGPQNLSNLNTSAVMNPINAVHQMRSVSNLLGQSPMQAHITDLSAQS